MNDVQNKYAPSVWGIEKFNDLECPSGQLAQVRQPGVQAMISSGVLQSADTLTSLVDQKHIKRVQGKAKPADPQIDGSSLIKDPENMKRVFDVVDRVTEYMVVQPVVRRPFERDDQGNEVFIGGSHREEGVIYTDQIDLMDRMFIFQYAVGGSTDVEEFRRIFTPDVGSLAVK